MKYVRSWIDRKTGRTYAFFRRRGYASARLPGSIGSAEFLAAYHACLRGEHPAPAIAEMTARTGPGTINAAVALYLDSNAFMSKVLGSTELQWKQVFAKDGKIYRAPVLVLYRGTTHASCGGAGKAPWDRSTAQMIKRSTSTPRSSIRSRRAFEAATPAARASFRRPM
jgi:hypothetical protein